jgi:hypothetical protein
MVIRTEYRGQRYSMGSSDPLKLLRKFNLPLSWLTWPRKLANAALRQQNRFGNCKHGESTGFNSSRSGITQLLV